MSLLASGLIAMLLTIAAVHAAWGLGVTWPAPDGASLARAVAGFKDVSDMPPPRASFAVAASLCGVAGCAFALGTHARPLPSWLVVAAGFGCSAAFIGRGVAAYLSAWRRLTPVEPFAWLDRAVYGPLCLVLGAGFGLLAIERMITP